jgi:prepilin-type processing-associated H-X9-DG protein
MQGNRGVSKADVVATAVVLFLLGALAPVLIADARKNGGDRQKCAANLRGIMQSMVVYSAENDDQYPYIGGNSAVKYDATPKPLTGEKEAEATIKGIYKDGKLLNNPAAALWLMVLRNQTSPKQFVCPGDRFEDKPAALAGGKDNLYYQNFQDGKNLSYSMAYMWQENKKKEIVRAAWWSNTTDSSLPIVSDMAPYLCSKAGAGEATTRPVVAPATGPDAPLVLGQDRGTALQHAISANHDFAGMNVAFADAHAEWVQRSDVGQSNESIFAATVNRQEVAIDAGQLPEKLSPTAPPFDIVMVPMRSAKGELK